MKDMRIYEVTFKNETSRYYWFEEDCQMGDMVVADTSHGPLLGRITDIVSELPDYLDAEKMRFILCRVPKEDEVVAKSQQASVTERLSEIEQKVKEEHLAQIEQMMDKFIEQHKNEVMRLVYADYNDDFNELMKEYSKLKDSISCAEEEDSPDVDVTA